MFDRPLPDTFTTTEVRSDDLDRIGWYTRRFGGANGANVYWLRDRHARPAARDILSVHREARIGDLRACFSTDRLGAAIEVVGEGHPCYCLVAPLSGGLALTGGPNGAAEADAATGCVVRGLPETRFVTGDRSERLVVWMDAGRLERTLQAWLGEPARAPRGVAPGGSWARGPGAGGAGGRCRATTA